MSFKRVIILSLTFLLVVSCQEKKDKIEIYLLNKRIVSSEGIPFPEMDVYDSLSNEVKESFKYSSYDLIDSTIIHAGKFNVSYDDIDEKPLVEDDEIISLNLKHNTIKIKSSGISKIQDLKQDMNRSIQFVLCVDKNPIITDYFTSIFSSFPPSTNHILVIPKNKDLVKIKFDEEITIIKNIEGEVLKMNIQS